MTGKLFLARVKYEQELKDVTDEDIMRVTGWSRKVFRARWADPGTIRLAEAEAIGSYLDIKFME